MPKGYEPVIIQAILDLNQKGLSSREIAGILGVSKSGVNYCIARQAEIVEHLDEQQYKETKAYQEGARIAILDTETAPAKAYTFTRKKAFFNQSNIAEEGGWMICAGYKFLGSPDVNMLFNTDDIKAKTDEFITCELFDLYERSDAVLAHNSQGFDHPVIQTRALIHGLGSLPSVKVLDTLKIARKLLRLPDNKLDTVAGYFGLGSKLGHEGIKLWIDTMDGCPTALFNMIEYCKHDVELLDMVYNRIRCLGHPGTSFNAGLYYDDDKQRCGVCGSDDLVYTGRIVTTQLSTFDEIRCNGCGAVRRSRQARNTKEERQKLNAPALN